MDLKKILKFIKLNERTISYILGILILFLSVLFVVRYIRNIGNQSNVGPSSTTQVQETVHTVTKGETLWSISQQYYQKGSEWKKIADANNITNPSKIEVGQSLTIPDITEASAPSTTTPTQSPTPEPQISKEAVSINNEITEDSYTVVKGDCLWTIALRAYGDGTKWHQIAEANKLSNPRIIHSGNVFTIPR